MNRTALILGIVILLFIGGVFMISGANPMTPAGDSAPAPQDTTTASADTDPTVAKPAEIREITIQGTEFAFAPQAFTVKKGEPVRLVFTNSGTMPHDWVVDELDVRTDIIDGGKQDVIEFTPEVTGTFEYYCSVGQHRANGMKGSLTVEE